MRVRATIFGAVLFIASPAVAAEATLGNWNIQTLTYQDDPLTVFPDDYRRQKQDFYDLIRWRDMAGADIFLLQEVTSPAAIDEIFPAAQGWKHCISGQYAKGEGLTAQPVCTEAKGSAAKPAANFRAQYTGVALRPGSAAVIEALTDLPSLNVLGDGTGVHPVRWGLDATLALGTAHLRVLVVHMKSGCFDDRLKTEEWMEDPAGKNPSSDSCVTLARQLFPLRKWIEAREGEGAAWMVVGDLNRRLDAGAGTFQDEVWSALSGYAPRPDPNTHQIVDKDTRPDIALYREPYKEASLCWREMRDSLPASLAQADDYNILPIEFFVFGEKTKPMLVPDSEKQVPWPAPTAADMKRLSDHCPKTIRIRG